jgi:transposase
MENREGKSPTLTVFLSDRRTVHRLLEEEPTMHSLARTAVTRLTKDQRIDDAYRLINIIKHDPHEERRETATILFDLLNPSLPSDKETKEKIEAAWKPETKLRQNRKQQLIELWPKHTKSEIAEKMDISLHNVKVTAERIRQEGVELPPKKSGPNPKAAAVTKQQVIELWPNHSIAEIAEKLDISPSRVTTIASRVRQEGVELPKKKSGPNPEATAITKQQLIELWPDHSLSEIAEIMDISKDFVNRIAHGVRRKGVELEKKRRPLHWRREQELIELWPSHSISEIAEIMDISKDFVNRIAHGVRRKGVELEKKRRRPLSEAREKQLVELWPSHTLAKIAEIMDISKDTATSLASRVRKKGVELESKRKRSLSEDRKQQLLELWPNYTVAQIAERLNISEGNVQTIASRVRKEGIELPQKRRAKRTSQNAYRTEQLIELWPNYTVVQIAERLNISEKNVNTIAFRARKNGVELPKKKRKGKPETATEIHQTIEIWPDHIRPVIIFQDPISVH